MDPRVNTGLAALVVLAIITELIILVPQLSLWVDTRKDVEPTRSIATIMLVCLVGSFFVGNQYIILAVTLIIAVLLILGFTHR